MDVMSHSLWFALTVGAVLSLAVVGSYLFFFRRRAARRPLGGEGRVPPAADVVPQKVAPDRRQSPRRWGLPIEVFINDGSSTVKGWVANRSEGGLCLSVSQALPVGALLNIRTTNSPDSEPWVTVEVKSCHFEVNRWLTGCRYVGSPPHEIIVLFG